MLATKNTLPRLWFDWWGNLINGSIEHWLTGTGSKKRGVFALINEHIKSAKHGEQKRSSTISTTIKTYDSKTTNTVAISTDINIKRRDQSCTGGSDFAFAVKKARRQPCPLPDQGHQGAHRSLEANRNPSRLKAYPQSTARSIT